MDAPLHVTTYDNDLPLMLLLAREETMAAYGSTTGSAAALPETETTSQLEPETDPETTSQPEPETESRAALDWSQVHQRIVQLGAERGAQERELCHWLVAAERLDVHRRTGYASLREYVERVVGLNGRQTEERLRVGHALVGLPLLDSALRSGQLCWSVVRELSRLATGQTEMAWIDWAKGRRSREVEQAVAARQRGDRPEDRSDPSLIKHRLRFEVRAETMALFRDLQAAVRRDLGGRVDDDMLLFEIARRALGGPGDEGRASYQIAVTTCESCGLANIDAGGESYAVESSVAEMAACDGQHVGSVDGRQHCRQQARPQQARPQQARPQQGSPHVGATPPAPTPPPSTVAVSAPSPQAAAPRSRQRRATQTIPPATRREVMRRHHKRCAAPGCRNHVFVDLHHLDPLGEGGSHDPDRIIALCGAHHRAAHTGQLCIDGTASRGFSFRHADGTTYGHGLNPPSLDVAQQAFSALTNMGFRPTEARALVDAVVHAGPPEQLAQFVHAALRCS